jgi:hypothetical protein
MNPKILAWHFVGKTLRDGSRIPRDGKLLIFKDAPIMCSKGYHASICPFDALQYAPGPILCRVECGGTLIRENDKLVCTERRILARIDATEMLRYYARQEALSVIHLWKAPQVVLYYLMTGHENIRDAAWVAARGAASGAARVAAWDAAWDAARDAAWAAARAAAWGAAREAAKDAQAVLLYSYLTGTVDLDAIRERVE